MSHSSTPQDYSHEVRLARSRVLRVVLLTAGTISLILGLLGIFLPLLPTTPFLLLTAFCYGRASERFYNSLMNQRHLGPYIRAWREGRGIPLRAKIVSVTILVLTLGSSVIFFVPLAPVKVLLVLIGTTVSVYILRQPTRRD